MPWRCCRWPISWASTAVSTSVLLSTSCTISSVITMVPPGRASAFGPMRLARNTSSQGGTSLAGSLPSAWRKAPRMRSCSAGGMALGSGFISCSSTARSVAWPRASSTWAGRAWATVRAASGRPHCCRLTRAATSSTALASTPRQFCCRRTTSGSRRPLWRAQASQAAASPHSTEPPSLKCAVRWPWRVRSGHRTWCSATVCCTVSPCRCSAPPSTHSATAWARAWTPSK